MPIFVRGKNSKDLGVKFVKYLISEPRLNVKSRKFTVTLCILIISKTVFLKMRTRHSLGSPAGHTNKGKDNVLLQTFTRQI